jgi:hypothetical protein
MLRRIRHRSRLRPSDATVRRTLLRPATMQAMARHAAKRRRGPLVAAAAAVVLVGVAVGIFAFGHSSTPPKPRALPDVHRSTTTTVPPTTTTTTSTLPAAAAGFEAGHVTAVGDSVMLDYQDPLETDIPGINVQAAVSRQWGDGEALLSQLKSEGTLGAEVIVGLGTNGPITDTDFDDMMSILQGASRIVFVNTHVDRPWQDPNNQVLASGAARYHHVFIADWATLAGQNPQWFGTDGTHLAIDGPGADALAELVTDTLSNG